MKFIEKQNNGTVITVEIPDHSTLDTVLEHFQNFLRACGYCIDYNKVLDFINMDEE